MVLDRGNEFDELIPDITGLKKMIILGESAPRVKRAADKAGVTYLMPKMWPMRHVLLLIKQVEEMLSC